MDYSWMPHFGMFWTLPLLCLLFMVVMMMGCGGMLSRFGHRNRHGNGGETPRQTLEHEDVNGSKAPSQSIRGEKDPKTLLFAAALVAVVIAASVPLVLAQTPGHGPGMMGGYGGYGMGPGMMGGYSMGSGMMGGYGVGYGGGAGLNLTDEQRSKIRKIQQELRSKQWDLNRKIRDEYARRKAASDDAAASKAEEQIAALQQQMFANATAARKQIDAVLTEEQSQQLKQDGY